MFSNIDTKNVARIWARSRSLVYYEIDADGEIAPAETSKIDVAR